MQDEHHKSIASPDEESASTRESNCRFESEQGFVSRYWSASESPLDVAADRLAEGDSAHPRRSSFSVRQRRLKIMAANVEASRKKLCPIQLEASKRSRCDDRIGSSSTKTTTTATTITNTVCDNVRVRAISELDATANENCNISPTGAVAVNNTGDDYGNYGEVPTRSTRHCHSTFNEFAAASCQNDCDGQQHWRQVAPKRLLGSGSPIEPSGRGGCHKARGDNNNTRGRTTFLLILATFFAIVVGPQLELLVSCQSLNSDPRPTIYSGQISFGLLLSAHSPPGADISTAASELTEIVESVAASGLTPVDSMLANCSQTTTTTTTTAATSSWNADSRHNETGCLNGTSPDYSIGSPNGADSNLRRVLRKRQIFERPSEKQVKRQQRQRELELKKQQVAAANAAKQQSAPPVDSACSQVNPDALYAGMGAIWASHQANLVGDSQLAIGTYVYDSCNDLEIGQRQSVRIVSNLNAFQQTTCEAPRGSPISLTIAHGENQLRAIQLLTSFKVPVITTREPFALEDYHLLSRDQRRFLFSTAPSSRYLAAGALKFAKRVVARSAASPKLPNQHHKMSSKNGLIVVSQNLPEKFVAYLLENIPNQVNYEMIQTSQPIEQVRSVETLERLLMRNSGSTIAGAAAGSSQSESRLSIVRLATNSTNPVIERRKRSDDQDQSSGGGSSSDSSDSDSSDSSGQQHRMLSPTILMFITPAEAMDLITRLRNDLADVSRYYSLIVTTREDISPALKTIFHKGGSHLCSGKAFHMISPKPYDVSEFSRYFRDTVSMEGESSDHPLICEFSKHQASSRTDSELDDISTEAVIKAVWSAAAAFKLVHERECAAALGANAQDKMGGPTGGGSEPAGSRYEQMATTSTRAAKLQGRRQSAAQTGFPGKSGLTPHAECLVKMNKNMSNLVRNALKRLDVYINSTGLQSLDGFRIKFDDFNELLTNRFSIKYVNKECEITELGIYSGSNESRLSLEEEVLIKSLESTVPDPWPISAPPPSQPAAPAASTPTVGSSKTTSADSGGSNSSSAANGNQDETSAGSGEDSNLPGGNNSKGGGDDEQESNAQVDNEKQPSTLIENEAPKRKRSNSKLAKRKIQQQELSIKQQPVAMSSGERGGEPSSRLPKGLTDSSSSETSGTLATEPPTTRRMTTNGPSFPLVTRSSTTIAPGSSRQPGRKLRPFPSGQSVSLKHWLPKEPPEVQTASDEPANLGSRETTTPRPPTARPGPTQLPESDGNTDLDMPAFKSSPSTTTKRPQSGSSTSSTARASIVKSERSSSDKMNTAASTTELTTEALDYVTLPSIARTTSHLMVSPIEGQANVDASFRPYAMGNYPQAANSRREPRLSLLRDSSNPALLLNGSNSNGTSRSRLRSHLKWIYGSWFTLTILGANICGALLTLYVLTFLLVKNCDGSLDHGNQGLRSMHLLSVIVVFFGSTLFIVYPTPSLCLLRSSWHNFALVLLFGSLLMQTMQTRSISSIGLGGRPNRLNQMLTLAFMVGVQVASELQRWKYETANYVNFVNQYLSSPDDGDKKLLALSNSIGSQFNPLNSFNDQVTPVSIQVSERYQNLLHDYCSQPVDDFLQSQFYLWIIMSLLVVFSITNRRQMTGQCKTTGGGGAGQLTSGKSSQGLLTKARARRDTSKLGPIETASAHANYALTSGKILASQHETNEILGDRLSPLARCQTFGGSVPFSMGSKAAAKRLHSTTTDVFIVTLMSVPIYFVSVVMRVQGQNSLVDDHHDLVASVTMILIAFTVLLGIFLPFLRNHHRFGELVSGPVSPSSSTVSAQLDRPILAGSSLAQSRKRAAALYGGAQATHSPPSTSNAAFAMFPEFASTGLRRPSSIGADSLGRRPFSETKESRRNMGLSLANLPPEPESLRNLCIHNHRSSVQLGQQQQQQHRVGMPPIEMGSEQHTPTSALNLKLSGVDEEPAMHDERQHQSGNNHHEHNHHHHQIDEPTKAQRGYKLNNNNNNHNHNLNHNHNNNHHHQHHHHRRSQPSASSRRSSISSAGEKRLIMLDVDPCCPRHGQTNGPNPAS